MESRAKAKQGIEVQSSHIAHQKICLTVRLRIFQQPYDSGIRMTLHDAIITQFQKSYDPKYHLLKEITFFLFAGSPGPQKPVQIRHPHCTVQDPARGLVQMPILILRIRQRAFHTQRGDRRTRE